MDSNSPYSISAPIAHNERHYSSETYVLPSDEAESRRLDLQHRILRTLFDERIVLAPLKLNGGAEVLEIGTGKGVWALDFVSTYPNADKAKMLCIDIGTRLFPQRPPHNVTFQQGNIVTQNALQWENRFAFVHQRLLIAGFLYDQWETVIQKIYTITAPGGWAQLLEANLDSYFSASGGPVTARSLEIYRALEKASGLDFLCSLRLEGLMKKAGFVDVQVTLRETPLGALYGEMGAQFADNLMGIFRGLKTPVLRLGGFGLVRDEQDYDDLMDEMELEWNERGCKAGWYVAVGRKV